MEFSCKGLNEMIMGVEAVGGIDRIKEQILEDAQVDAERIITEAEDRARALKEKKAEEAGNLRQRLIEESSLKAQERKRRMLTAANLEMKKNILAVKQEMINKVLEEALNAIEQMPVAEYRSIIAEMLMDTVISGDETVVFSERDQDRLDAGFLAGVNIKLREQGKKGELKLAPQRGRFRSGFVLVYGGLEINNSFESIIRMSRNELESEVAEILFGEEG
jgi:V/A-type H+-transporting ATPase subunit E